MKLSVIIPTCNRPDELALCLQRLDPAAQSMAADQFEVIVTDDSPGQATEQRVKAQFPWVRWVQGPRRGPAANRNNGARCASAEWLVFTDDDCLPEPTFLGAYAGAMERPDCPEVLEGRTSAIGTKDHPLASAPINESGGYLWSCNFAIRSSVFRAVGGFDEDFPFAAMEDSDLELRLRRMAVRRLFVRDAAILHPWKMPSDMKLHWRRHLKSQMIFLRKHPEEKERFAFSGHFRSMLRYAVKGLFLGFFRNGPSVFRHQPLIWWGNFYAAWVLLVKPDPAKMKT